MDNGGLDGKKRKMNIKLSDYSLPFWIVQNGILTEKGEPFEFKQHFFLYDILRDQNPKKVIKKCSQVGMSVGMNLDVFHKADKQGISTIYTMPSDSDVQEFSKTKTDKIFQQNDVIRKRIKLDNVELKQIGNTFIYFKGTRSKAAPISTTTDNLVHDELDRSDLDIVSQYGSRTQASKYKGETYLSNPSTYNIGIDLFWKRSNQREWFIVCEGCNASQYLTWEDNVDEIKGIYVCKECGKELTDMERVKGKWIATGQGRFSGYHISQMMAPWLTARELINEKETKGVEYFRNFVLGEPYSVGEGADFRQMITDSATFDSLDSGPLYMGVDVGKEKHWVLGNARGIFKIGKCESREELESVIARYNPFVVMDSGPERTWAEEFKKKYPKVNLCFYRKDRNVAEMVEWGGEKGNFEDRKNIGYLWIDRNRVIDAVVYDMQRHDIQYSLPREDLERLISHWETMRRVEEITPLHGKRYVWESSTGVNHFASGLWFYWLARKRAFKPVEIISNKTAREQGLVVVTSEGQKMRDLREMFESGELGNQ